MKIVTSKLAIELLQTCNLDCRHCLNGDKRNVFVSKEIIEKLFDEVKLIGEIIFTGGEVFLAYEQMKMVLEVAQEKGVSISSCSILTNGTVYDERIYDLLDDYFNDNYSVSISNDDYHDKSIRRVFKDKEEEAFKNIEKHYLKYNSAGFKRAETILINTGRAKDLDKVKSEYEAIGYYYDFYKKTIMLAGPIIFMGADGYVTEGNLEIASRSQESLDNILNKSLSDMILYGGVRIKTSDISEFFDMMNKREDDYQNRRGDHWRFKEHKMIEYEPVLLTEYYQELEQVHNIFTSFFEAGSFGGGLKKILDYDFSRYPHDLSQVDHDLK